MIRLSSLALILGITFAGIASVQAMPAAPLDQLQSGITVPVAGGCGAGWHRGRAADAVATDITAECITAEVQSWLRRGQSWLQPAPCGGRGTHRVCNPYRCWRVCN